MKTFYSDDQQLENFARRVQEDMANSSYHLYVPVCESVRGMSVVILPSDVMKISLIDPLPLAYLSLESSLAREGWPEVKCTNIRIAERSFRHSFIHSQIAALLNWTLSPISEETNFSLTLRSVRRMWRNLNILLARPLFWTFVRKEPKRVPSRGPSFIVESIWFICTMSEFKKTTCSKWLRVSSIPVSQYNKYHQG
jgi:hypothetical protein